MRPFLPTLLLAFCLVPGARADEASAVAALRNFGAVVERDEKAPGKPVFRVGLGSRRLEQLALLQELPGLRELSLYTEMGDEHLAALVPLKKLESLSLAYSRVRDPGLKHLARWKNLRKISFNETAVSDEGLKHLAGLENLRDLDLSKTNAGGSGLAGLTGLVSVDLKESRARDADLAVLGKLPNLERLDLSRTAVSDAGMKHLAGLPRLKELSLAGSILVGPAGLASLADAPALESLSLPGGSSGRAVVRALQGSKSLTVVSFPPFPALDEQTVASLAAAKKLHWLQAAPTPERPAVSSQAELRRLFLRFGAGRIVPHLKDLDGLTSLGLPGVQLGEGDLAILAGMPTLRRLDLSGVRGATDEDLAQLAALTKLRRLDVSNLPLTDTSLGKLAGLSELEYLGAARTKITSRSLAGLAAGLPKLRVLRAEGNLTFTDLLAAGPPAGLESVGADVQQLTDDELRALARAGKLHWLYGNNANVFSNPPVQLPTPPLLNLTSGRLSPDGAAIPEDIGDIKALNFSGGRLTDEGLKRLASLKGVELLHLSQTRVSDEGLKHLVGMKSLRQVYLYNISKISAEGLHALAAAPALEQVAGAYPPSEDAILADLVKRNRLHVVANAFALGNSRLHSDDDIHSLNLNGPKVTGAGLKTVAGLKGLRNLWLASCTKAVEDLDALKGAKALDRLDIHGVQLTPAQVVKLQGHPSLRHLALGGMKMNGELLDALAKLDTLEVLWVGHLAYPAGEVKRLEKFKHLKNLGGLVTPTDALVKELVRIGKPEWVPGAARIPFGIPQGPSDVRSLRLEGTTASAETLKDLFEALPNVEDLYITGRDMKTVPLGSLRRLRGANLTWTWMSGDDLARLELPDSLERLTVQPSSVTDGFLKALAVRKKLHTLSLPDRAHFSIMPPEESLIESLDLSQCRITGASLEVVGSLESLRTLNLSGVGVDDEALAHLAGLKKLEVLNLNNCKEISDAGTAKLAGLPLKSVNIRGTKLTGKGLLPLVKSPGIRTVETEPWVADDGVLKELAGRARVHVLLGKDGPRRDEEVTFLALNGKGVTGAGLRHLTGLTHLTSLNLNSSGATDEGMEALAALPALRNLGLVSTPVTDAGVEKLLESKSLTIVRAPKPAVTDRLLEKAVGEGRLRLFDFATGPKGEPKAVTKLDLRGSRVGDAGLKALKGLDRLEHLILSGTPVTDAGLDELKNFPALRVLELARVKGVSKEKVAELKKARPGLVVRE